jgi:hypothetical protein
MLVSGPTKHGLLSYWSQTVCTFKVNMNLTFDPLTQESINLIYLPSPMHLRSLSANSSWVVKLLIRNWFNQQGQCYFDRWLIHPKINMGHALAKVLYLLIGNHFVFWIYTPSSLKGGIKIQSTPGTYNELAYNE